MNDPYSKLEPLVRNILAEFGEAYFQSESLHRELCIVYAISRFEDPSHITGPRFEEVLEEAFAMTLGPVIRSLEPQISEGLSQMLAEALRTRNFLAHRFWFERVQLMYSEEGLERLLNELHQMAVTFHSADEAVMGHFQGLKQRFGLTQEELDRSMAQVVAGKPPDPPFPQRKIRKVERIVQAWEVPAANSSTLVFESEDGTFWQLCDVGLGWSKFSEVGEEWKPIRDIKPFLPAEINPRPGVESPWTYQLGLRRDAHIWVKPGVRPHSFRWGLSTG